MNFAHFFDYDYGSHDVTLDTDLFDFYSFSSDTKFDRYFINYLKRFGR